MLTPDDERTLQALEAVDIGEHDGTQDLHNAGMVCIVRFPPNPFGLKYRASLTDAGRAKLAELREKGRVATPC